MALQRDRRQVDRLTSSTAKRLPASCEGRLHRCHPASDGGIPYPLPDRQNAAQPSIKARRFSKMLPRLPMPPRPSIRFHAPTPIPPRWDRALSFQLSNLGTCCESRALSRLACPCVELGSRARHRHPDWERPAPGMASRAIQSRSPPTAQRDPSASSSCGGYRPDTLAKVDFNPDGGSCFFRPCSGQDDECKAARRLAVVSKQLDHDAGNSCHGSAARW